MYAQNIFILSIDYYPDIIFIHSTMYLLCDHCSFESNVYQFIWTIIISKIFSTTILHNKHTKSCFFFKKQYIFALYKKSSPYASITCMRVTISNTL